MLCCAREQWLFAAFSFTVAATSRSNGIFLSGFILWGLVVEPVLRYHRVRFLYCQTKRDALISDGR